MTYSTRKWVTNEFIKYADIPDVHGYILDMALEDAINHTNLALKIANVVAINEETKYEDLPAELLYDVEYFKHIQLKCFDRKSTYYEIIFKENAA